MKIFISILLKIYWAIVAGIPFIPPFVLFRYHSVLSCADNGICFRNGYPFLNTEGLSIVYFSMALLWPVCLWELIAKHFFNYFAKKSRIKGKLNMPGYAKVVMKLYWMIIATIPLMLWYLFGTYHAPIECVAEGGCIKFYLPLDLADKIAVLISCSLLWPVCILKLGLKFHNRQKMENRVV